MNTSFLGGDKGGGHPPGFSTYTDGQLKGLLFTLLKIIEDFLIEYGVLPLSGGLTINYTTFNE